MPPSGTRRNTLLDRRAGQRARFHFWLRRAVIIGGAAVLVIGGLVYASQSGYFEQIGGRTARAFHGQMAESGFAVRNLYITGRANTDRNYIKEIVDVDMGESIFSPDLDAVRARLENISWVRRATVERHFPDTLAINLEERVPIALWQHQNKLFVIDDEGIVLTDRDVSKFKNLLLLVGEQAPKYAAELVAMIAVEKDLAARTQSAKWVGDRRWDLYLKNGVVVKLPEDDVGQAVRRLAKAQGEGGLMDRNVQSIDLRDPVRIVVQTKPGAAEEYQANFKKEKNI